MMRDSLHPVLQGFVDRGWPIFPCNPKPGDFAKQPLTPKASAPGAKDGGLYRASTDAAVVADFWQRNKGALIGLRCGPKSAGGAGITVIDLDVKQSSAEAMLDALVAWCGGINRFDPETGEVFRPAMALTQSGGLHLYFAAIEPFSGCSEGNRGNLFAQMIKQGEAPPELAFVDVRGAGAAGGYVIAPPSRMADGRRYQWIVPPGETLPMVPTKLLRLIRRESAAKIQPAHCGPPRVAAEGRYARYVDKTVSGLCAVLRKAGAGNRNQAIFWVSRCLGEMSGAGLITRGEAERAVLSSLPDGVSASEEKANGTMRRGFEMGLKNPVDLRALEQGRAA